jgi:hypothetical protein
MLPAQHRNIAGSPAPRLPDAALGRLRFRFVVHFFVSGASRDEASARTHELALEEPLWGAFDALLAAARFWDAPAESGRCGLDGSTDALEARTAGRRHKVVRWSPNPIVSGAS